MVEPTTFRNLGREAAQLARHGITPAAADQLEGALEIRPTRADVKLWISESEKKMYWRLGPLWLANLGALVAMLYKVFGA